MLECLVKIGSHWVKFFSSVKVKNGYVDQKLAAEAPPTQGDKKICEISTVRKKIPSTEKVLFDLIIA